MPFVLRTTSTPPLSTITELEQIIIVDATGPTIPLGISDGVVCITGETLKGPFTPYEVTSYGDILSFFVGDPTVCLNRISQAGTLAASLQDGTAVGFDGNVFAELKNKQFKRLAINRVDADAVSTSGGTAKCAVKFTVTIDSTDGTSTTNKAITIPAGTRFADAVLASATVVVALSQDITIPSGTTITAGAITVDQTFANGNGTYGATCFFVKGITAATTVINTAIDTAIPNVNSTISASGISTILVSSGGASGVFAPGTAALTTLADKMASLYPAALARTVATTSPSVDIVHEWSARNYNGASTGLTAAIRTQLWLNAQNASIGGRGRTCSVSVPPAPGTTAADAATAKAAALALQSEFSGINADRVDINFIYTNIFSTELAKNILVSPSGWKASMVSQEPPEVQTGVANTFMQTIQSVETAFVTSPLVRADFVNLKAAGVSTILKDRAVGWWFQSSVTAVNPVTYPTRVFDNRRRFADFVQDTLAGFSAVYNKQPATTARVDALVGSIDAFLASLLSQANPAQQRIEGYLIDPTSANTPALTGLGIRTIIVKVRMLGDLNDIVFQTEIGPTVTITQTA